ncbi:MAG: CDP-alcohol phosphatidyltransferase family protein [Bacillota bacterium]
MTYANILTLVRLFLAPCIAYLFFLPGLPHTVAGGILLLASAFTDVADGYLARKRGEITLFGQIMDPIADKAVIFCSLAALSLRYGLPWFIPGFYLAKEIVQVTAGAFFLRRRHCVISANWLGKGATSGFYGGILCFLFPLTRRLKILWFVLFVLSLCLSLLAGISYARQIRKRPG